MKKLSRTSSQQHYSPLRYPGGKTFLSPLLGDIIKTKGLSNVTYVEPFAGGAGAALALLCENKVERIVINDLDKAIYAFWRAAILHTDRFITKIRSTRVTVAEWRRQREIYRNPKSLQFDLGFAAFFLNRTNVSGILDGGLIGGLAQQGDWKLSARFYKNTLIDRIQRLGSLRGRIAVQKRDGLDLIADYLGEENVLVYLDPPYYEKGGSLYLNHYSTDDHATLARTLNSNFRANWVLTYDDKKEIRSLYPKRHVVEYSLFHNARHARRGKEIMILSDSLKGALTTL